MAKSRTQPEMFAEEREALLAAKRELEAAKRKGAGLHPGYARLTALYEKLLKEMKKMLHISDAQGFALIQVESELKALLDNAGQGFLTFDRSLIVQKQYSAECRRIFGKRIGGLSFAELVWPDNREMQERVKLLLSIVFAHEDEVQRQRFLEELPKLVQWNSLRLRLEYKRIGVPERPEEERVMVVLTDVTEQLASKEQLAYLSTHDTLTDLYNRNYADNWALECKAAGRLPLSLVMADMNGLKLVNDVFGHLQGDKLLVRAADIIRRTFGEDAVCARWGGDEFLILLPETAKEACAAKVKELEEACERSDPYPIKISMATGTATLYGAEDDYSQLYLQAEKEMYKKKLIESRNVRRSLIENISEMMYARGIEDPAHVERVTEMASALAERMGIPRHSPQMSMLILLARLHDVGKIAIPRETFHHRHRLSEEEWDVVKTHSEIGYRLAFSLGEPALAEAILAMHEHWDGSGYPYGLKGDQIPEMARLLAVVDTFDVMTHDQVYRRAVSKEEALREIAAASGRQFDPQIVDAFLQALG